METDANRRMNADEFAFIRKKLRVSKIRLGMKLGIHESTILNYERGLRAVPGDIAETMNRFAPKSYCVRCSAPAPVEFWDRCCGACTEPLPSDD